MNSTNSKCRRTNGEQVKESFGSKRRKLRWTSADLWRNSEPEVRPWRASSEVGSLMHKSINPMRKLVSMLVPCSLFAALHLAATAQPLVNLGLVGVGRIPADSFDGLGVRVDTLGGVFSGMALNPASFLKSGNAYLADVLALPDRGLVTGQMIITIEFTRSG